LERGTNLPHMALCRLFVVAAYAVDFDVVRVRQYNVWKTPIPTARVAWEGVVEMCGQIPVGRTDGCWTLARDQVCSQLQPSTTGDTYFRHCFHASSLTATRNGVWQEIINYLLFRDKFQNSFFGNFASFIPVFLNTFFVYNVLQFALASN
jgi:hypothetical protein